MATAPRLQGKVAIVTGAGSSGPGWSNGRATAVLFAREGATVVLADQDRDSLAETVRIIADEGGQCESAVLDVLDEAATVALAERCAAVHGRIDVLHCNVGRGTPGGPLDIPTGVDYDESSTELRMSWRTARGPRSVTIPAPIAVTSLAAHEAPVHIDDQWDCASPYLHGLRPW